MARGMTANILPCFIITRGSSPPTWITKAQMDKFESLWENLEADDNHPSVPLLLRFRIVQQRRFLVQLAVPPPAASPSLDLFPLQCSQRTFNPSRCWRQRRRTPWDDQEPPVTAAASYRRSKLLPVTAGSLRDTTWQRSGQPTHRWVMPSLCILIG